MLFIANWQTSSITVNLLRGLGLGLLCLISACGEDSTEPEPPESTPKRTESSWVLSGGRNPLSYKNNHYSFTLDQAGPVTIELESSASEYLYLLDDLGLTVAAAPSSISETLTEGTYKIVVATLFSDETGNYVLSTTGIDRCEALPSDYSELTESWTSSGGRNQHSFRNKHFGLVVPNDTYLDIRVETAPRAHLYLIDMNGLVVQQSSASDIGTRDLAVEVAAGTYEIVVATYFSGESSSFQMKVFGHYDAPTSIESDNEQIQDSWTSSGGRSPGSFTNRHFSVTIPSDTYLDIRVETTPRAHLYLVDMDGLIVKQSPASDLGPRDLSLEVAAGTYEIVAATYLPYESSSFRLNVDGQFESLNPIISELSQAGSWISSGGKNAESEDNPNFSFEVTETGVVDIVLTSDISEYIFLKTPDTSILEQDGSHMQEELEPGMYTIVVATKSSGESGPFSIGLYGRHVQNFQSR